VSLFQHSWRELGNLASVLCEGQITPEEAARLEELARSSAEAKRYLLHYLQLHGELYWEHAVTLGDRSSSGPAGESPACAAGMPLSRATATAPRKPRLFPRQRLRWLAGLAAAGLAASLMVGVGWWLTARHRSALIATAGGTSPAPVARLTRLVAAEWTGDGRTRREGAALAAGETLPLAEGLAEISFDHGARVILRGPAGFEIQSADGGLLRRGSLTARVGPSSAGFTVRTPDATIVDLGTEFGVAVQEGGPSQIEVFAGQVLVHPSPHAIRPRRQSKTSAWRTVDAGQAVRVCCATGGHLAEIEPIAPGKLRLVRQLPPPGLGSVADLRRLVGGHPHLIHHYTFEGATPQQQRRDRRGSLPLTEVVMKGGRGGGELGYAAEGFDATTQSVAPYRWPRLGNDCGIALETETAFQPPPAMTIELLLNFAGFSAEDRSPIAAALATRADERHCGFLLAVVGDGQLTHLMDSQAPWVEAELGRVGLDGYGPGSRVQNEGCFTLIPGDWYYVASTFRAVAGKTVVNTYVANLSRGERTLSQVVKDQSTPGAAAASRLGIGKAFDANTAHAYPWCGRLDEIAIYDAILSSTTLAGHLQALAGTSRPSPSPAGRGP
jgi:hypothetical protein